MAPKRAGRKSNPNGAPIVELVEVGALKFHPRNYRKHPDDQLDHIVRSIKEHGFYRNVVVARDDTILAGAGVVQAARKAGIDKVPVIRLDISPDDRRAWKVLAGDNEIGRGAEVDDRALTELLREIMGGDPKQLLGTGFDDQQLAALVMVTRNTDEIADFNAANHWLGLPEYDAGKDLVSLTVFFGSKKERDKFAKRAGLDPGLVRVYADGLKWTTYWPDQRQIDLKSVKVASK